MNKPSKGPWEMRQSPQNMNYFIFSPDHKQAIAGINRLIGKGAEEGFANANILGAAHDLLEALELAKPYVMSATWHIPSQKADYAFKKLTEAIAKATNNKIMRTVYIPACEQHEGCKGISITVEWVCPVCGKPRGMVHKAKSFDGSRCLSVDGWVNPCGHVDKYSALRKESGLE